MQQVREHTLIHEPCDVCQRPVRIRYEGSEMMGWGPFYPLFLCPDCHRTLYTSLTLAVTLGALRD